MSIKSSLFKAGLALFIANLLWGAGPPIFKWSFENVPVFTLAFFRYCIPVVLIALLFPKYLKVHLKDVWFLVVTGIFSITINIGLYFVGIAHTASINAPIIASAGPAFVILGGMIFLRERPTKQMLLGNIIGLTGVLLIVAEPLLMNSGHSSLTGNLLLLVSDISAAIGTILAKDIIQKYHPITMTFWMFFVGTITFLPFFGQDVLVHGLLPHLNMQGVIGILYGGLFASFTAWLLFFYGLSHELASNTSIFNYTQPIMAILIAAPLLHEFPHTFFFLGAILVFFGMFVAENHRKNHSHQTMKK